MKRKLLTILFIGLLVFSCLNVALAAKVKCPKCNGTGSIVCPECDGTGTIAAGTSCPHCSGTGTLKPTVSLVTTQVDQHDGATYVTGIFHNTETFDVDGTVTASLGTHSNSEAATFTASSDTTVTVGIDYVGSYSTQFQLMHDLQMSVGGIADVTCPYCDGTGTNSQTTTCTECQGTGTIECPTCGGTGYVDEALVNQSAGVPLVAIVAVVVVAVAGGGVGAFMVLKKRRVSEQSLRKLSSRAFNDWVISRLDGKSATSRDTAMGIDGFTMGGHPVLIKQSDDIAMPVIDSFAASLARNRARNGVIVGFSFGSDAVRGKVRAKLNYKLEIEMLTVKDLIYSKRRL